MASALDTLCGQAYGAGQHRLVGVYKQRGMLVFSLVSIPVSVIWAYSGKILVLLRQDPEIAAGAGSYMRWMIPAPLLVALLQCHVRFLQSQNVVLPVMLSSGIAAVAHVAVCWLLVFTLGLGANGAALAIVVSNFLNLSFLALYVRLSPLCKDTWTGFSRDAIRDIPSFLKLAVLSAIMVCLECWSFELLVLLGGVLPNPKLETAVLSIWLGYAFSNVEEVALYYAKLMPILDLCFLFDSMECVLSGVIRGCGQQKMGAFVNFPSYYLVGIPVACIFAFVCHLRGRALKAKDRLFNSVPPADTKISGRAVEEEEFSSVGKGAQGTTNQGNERLC
ncbi:hypothetical protein PR202_gb06900 [Eleusine coracana subsp. coracana]|uniref:Protein DETOXIFICATION n=1 Tax=Eleusine coracana subsp. coracana TaxID=191504 RepID=A0AAV5EBN5_ELECO|nr:hypothetical protein PR202_gb06900 [Eleusine coracana subsp. coracana]